VAHRVLDVAGDDIYFDWVALVPVAEGSGEARVEDYTGSPLAGTAGVQRRDPHDGALGQNSAGTYWIAPDVYEGDYLLVPPSGLEARTLRVIVRFGRHIPLRAGQTTTADHLHDLSGRHERRFRPPIRDTPLSRGPEP
jgi:hypothetical protein